MAGETKLSHTAAMILQAIGAGHGYGFSVMEMTGLPSGTVYPALRRLERDDLIRSQWEKQVDRRCGTAPGPKVLQADERRQSDSRRFAEALSVIGKNDPGSRGGTRMSLPAAILMSARWLVPPAQRAEWFAEWDAELRYILRACDPRALAFCLGAYKDAWWLRRQCPRRLLNSPLQCLALLAIIAAISLMSAGRAAFSSPFRDARGLVELPDMPADQSEAIRGSAGPLFAGLAFYQRVSEPVRGQHGMALYSIVRGNRNLFEVLNVPLPRSVEPPALIVSRSVWQMDFNGGHNTAGRFLEVEGRRVPVAGVIADDAWPLAGRVDAWLLEDTALPDLKRFAVGRLVSGGIAGSGSSPTLLRRPARRLREFIGVFELAMIACLMVAVTASLKLGVARGARSRAFLLAKTVLFVPTVYGCAFLAFSVDMPFAVIFQLAVFPGSVFAVCWAVADQTRRCPVCLRLLSSPVLLGKASQTFLGWYGTEWMCAQGHGVLRVPELAASSSSARQWVNLEELWATAPG